MVTQFVFFGFILLMAAQRLFEMRKSASNEKAMFARGAKEHAVGQLAYMKMLHTAWFFSMLVEVYFFSRPFWLPLFCTALLATFLGQALRYAAMKTLGQRWSIRIITLHDAPPVNKGIFSFIRHPNYLGVILEIAFVPLLHSAWFTSIVFTILNALLLRVRIREEEKALNEGGVYVRNMKSKNRFFPAVGAKESR